MDIELLAKETSTKIKELSIIFNTVISLKWDESGFYTEMFINHTQITISMWVLEHQSVEYIAKQIVDLVVANFDTEV